MLLSVHDTILNYNNALVQQASRLSSCLANTLLNSPFPPPKALLTSILLYVSMNLAYFGYFM